MRDRRQHHPPQGPRPRQRPRQDSRLDGLYGPILRAIGDDARTPAEVVAALPQYPPKAVRRALLELRDAGTLDRITDPQITLYSRREAA